MTKMKSAKNQIKSKSNHHKQQQHSLIDSTSSSIDNDNDNIESIYSNIIDLIDRFLDTDDNLLVQALTQLEQHTNISKKYLARVLMIFMATYLLFSYSFINHLLRILMYLYPSYCLYYKLKYTTNLNSNELILIIKFWIFMSFFITLDLLFGDLIPLNFLLKIFLIIQLIIPLASINHQNSMAICFCYDNIITPCYTYVENLDYIKQLNQYLQLNNNQQRPQSYHNELLDSMDNFNVR